MAAFADSLSKCVLESRNDSRITKKEGVSFRGVRIFRGSHAAGLLFVIVGRPVDG